MDERRRWVIWVRLSWALLPALAATLLVIWSFFSLGDEPAKATALAVLALFFQRAAREGWQDFKKEFPHFVKAHASVQESRT